MPRVDLGCGSGCQQKETERPSGAPHLHATLTTSTITLHRTGELEHSCGTNWNAHGKSGKVSERYAARGERITRARESDWQTPAGGPGCPADEQNTTCKVLWVENDFQISNFNFSCKIFFSSAAEEIANCSIIENDF